jgi:hypothetical protein
MLFGARLLGRHLLRVRHRELLRRLLIATKVARGLVQLSPASIGAIRPPDSPRCNATCTVNRGSPRRDRLQKTFLASVLSFRAARYEEGESRCEEGDVLDEERAVVSEWGEDGSEQGEVVSLMLEDGSAFVESLSVQGECLSLFGQCLSLFVEDRSVWGEDLPRTCRNFRVTGFGGQAGRRPSKWIWNWFMALFHVLGGMSHFFSALRSARKRSLVAASSLGKWPFERMILRSW